MLYCLLVKFLLKISRFTMFTVLNFEYKQSNMIFLEDTLEKWAFTFSVATLLAQTYAEKIFGKSSHWQI